ncbi:hypothetical protein FA13DRAFT_1734026 [Coprinellus micaceus]|uniref:Uncharacterized protein n=1 Tax=Coprinellus micaceus TaxID=71717 RepID=A0A4Y7T8C1_COPMI|nr:hypothetical protein FA13DRAFT_1734026 [Coprinellus micaceus]
MVVFHFLWEKATAATSSREEAPGTQRKVVEWNAPEDAAVGCREQRHGLEIHSNRRIHLTSRDMSPVLRACTGSYGAQASGAESRNDEVDRLVSRARGGDGGLS